jgi:hypothetical protein
VTCLCSCNHYRGFLSQPTTSLFSLVTAPCSCKSHSHSLRTACKSHCLHAALRPCKPHSHCPWLTCKSYWCKLKQALIISLAQSLNARLELLPNTWAIVEAPMPSFVTCPLYLIPSLHRCTRVSVICQNTRGFQVTHNFSCNHYWGFQCDPQLPFIEGFSATHNFLLSRVSVRPTTSLYRGFQCDPQLPFISLFFTALCSCKSLSHNHRSPCKSHKQSLRSTCKSQALWHIEAASTSPVSQALALNSDIS